MENISLESVVVVHGMKMAMELEKLKEYPSPDMSFDVDYVNSDTGKYSYTISASTNNNIITFFIDNKKC